MIEGIRCTFITKLFSIDIILDFEYSEWTPINGIKSIGCQNIHLNFRLHSEKKIDKKLYIRTTERKVLNYFLAETSNLIKRE